MDKLSKIFEVSADFLGCVIGAPLYLLSRIVGVAAGLAYEGWLNGYNR